MDFGNDYWNALDHHKRSEYEISPKDIGLSAGIGDPWEKVKAHITAGATHVELGFMGVGKGSASQPTGVTPGSIGKAKREDIRRMAKATGVTLSTHASANIIGFAGAREGKFDDQAAANAMAEVKRAIEFAADTAQGGSVVVHLGEYPREVGMAPRTGLPKGERFVGYETEEKKSVVPLVDTESGKFIGIPKDIKIPKVAVDPKTGKPLKNEETGTYKYEEWGYEDYVKEAKGDPEKAAEMFYKDYLKKQLEQAHAEERRWYANAEDAYRQWEFLQRRLKSIEDQYRVDPESAKRNAALYVKELGQEPPPGSPQGDEYDKNPLGYFKKLCKKFEREYRYYQDASIAHGKEVRNIERQMQNVKPIREATVERTAKNLADLGMYAYEVEKKKKLKKPLFIAPENVFPEQFGSHPQEQKQIILAARKAMVEKLKKKKGLSQKEAEKIAKEHIKATFDIGHAYTWKKYFTGADKDFKKWVVEQAKDLQKSGVLGEIHIADNFGYADEHLTPGQGDAPIEETIKEIRKAGFKGPMVLEGGAQTEAEGGLYSAMVGGWAHLAKSPMYRIDGVQQSWTDITGSYFGRTAPSTFYLSGHTAPPKDWGKEMTFWSETPIE